MQLDIFEHSRDVMLRNDTVQALQARDAPAMQAAWARLQAEFPADAALGPLALLGEWLTAPVGDLPTAVQRLRRQAVPAAAAVFGPTQAAAWLAPLWRVLAERAAAAGPVRPDELDEQLHPAALWREAGEWAAMAAAVATIPSWRRVPLPLGWMAEARWRQLGLDAAWPLLAELAWLAPARFDALSQAVQDPVLTRWRRRFDAQFEGSGGTDDLAWLPAWLLTEQPALAERLAQAQPGLQRPPEVALRLLVELLGLERQGRQADIVNHRRRLRDLHAGLFQAYLRTR